MHMLSGDSREAGFASCPLGRVRCWEHLLATCTKTFPRLSRCCQHSRRCFLFLTSYRPPLLPTCLKYNSSASPALLPTCQRTWAHVAVVRWHVPPRRCFVVRRIPDCPFSHGLLSRRRTRIRRLPPYWSASTRWPPALTAGPFHAFLHRCPNSASSSPALSLRPVHCQCSNPGAPPLG